MNKTVQIIGTPPSVVISSGEVVAGQIMVMLQNGSGLADAEDQLRQHGLILKDAEQSSRSMRIWTLSFVPETNMDDALKTCRSIPSVQLAQFNHYVAPRAVFPNDSLFPQLWNMDNTGQSGGFPDADIDAPEAWNITTGGMTVAGDTIVVAVIDGGFSLTHQDLNFRKNYFEIPGNGIDDDNNGYIDDYDGWNAYNSSGNLIQDNHGTHVTGIVGARGNNVLGVTGINWNVQIMPVMGSSQTESEVVEAYTYVLDARRLWNQTNGQQGAFVVASNSSFGVNFGQPANFPIWCAMYDSLGQAGILNACATANLNIDVDAQGDIPTACASPFMIGITNTTRFDQRNSSAAYGLTTIDLGAPGTQVLSTINNNQYSILTGTSMATPHVAGAIALMYAAACPQLIADYKLYPDSISLLMLNLLLNSTDPITSLNGQTVTGGRLNINNALMAVQNYCLGNAVNESSDNTQVTVYPNPADKQLFVRCSLQLNQPVHLSLMDLMGIKVYQQQYAVDSGSNEFSIDISAIASGVYILNIEQEGVRISSRKVLVE
ncbi:MAG: hypothetical protein Fur0041_04870 [Bacteroidia bacterium]